VDDQELLAKPVGDLYGDTLPNLPNRHLVAACYQISLALRDVRISHVESLAVVIGVDEDGVHHPPPIVDGDDVVRIMSTQSLHHRRGHEIVDMDRKDLGGLVHANLGRGRDVRDLVP
jgi:hypothetical protein